MENLSKLRTPLRSSFSKTEKRLSDLLKTEIDDPEAVHVFLALLEDKWKQLDTVDKQIIEMLQCSEDVPQESFVKEIESIESYNDKYIEIKVRTERILKKWGSATVQHETQSENKTVFENENTDNVVKRKFKLPELELKKFDGNYKNWLSFWSQFQKIHSDPEIPKEDKYQYLIQSTISGSRAREIVDSFPAAAEYYDQVIECFQSRFGREDILIEVYVRELLGLVLNSATNRENRLPLIKLYDKIETYLRSLKLLGVTSDKCVAILYPLVESCLPLDLLRVWERNNFSAVDANSADAGEKGNKLDSLLCFLRGEIQGEERAQMARQGFGLGQTKENKKVRPFENHDARKSKPIPTGMELMSTSCVKDECVFCGKSHPSVDCRNVNDLSYTEKRTVLMKKGACFKCLKFNHLSRNCKVRINCMICGKWHHKIMCPGKSSDDPIDSRGDKRNDSESTALSNQTNSMSVVLQTLVVVMKNGNRKKSVRALIDSGSTKSYVRRDVIDLLGYQSKGEICVVHTLFGGKLTPEETHEKFQIHIYRPDDSVGFQFEVLDQKTICNEVPKIPHGDWIEELRKNKITLSDTEHNIDVKDDTIHLLIGADVAGKLLSGRIFSCSSGPVAVETKLGWTLMGKIPSNTDTVKNTLYVSSLLSNDIENLWKLDTIGISDKNLKDDKEISHQETMEYFQKTLARSEEGRYEVALPWVVDSCNLPSNRELAEKRLLVTKTRLKNSGKTEAYREVFASWEREGIIEEIISDKEQECVHYLPHRPVFKENSETTKIRPVFDASAHKKGSPSLNDCLEKGPNLIEVIPSMINKFRKNEVAATADIEKAFLQIGIRKQDRDFLRFLMFGEDGKLVEYRHRRVVFGVSSSPFLLNSTLAHHCTEAPEQLKDTAVQLKQSFYVDNCVASFRSVPEMEKFVVESRVLLAEAHFNLRDWKTNATSNLVERQTDEKVNLLGLTWNLKDDCSSQDFKIENEISKRKLLSIVSRIFDPGGWWERQIGILKRMLRKILGKTSLDFEEMVTILCDCESTMNKRPLTYVSEDKDDLVPLSPNMFLQEVSEAGVPDLDQLDAAAMSKRLRYRQRIRNELRVRFRSEYLGQLRQLSKFVKDPQRIKVGDVVLIGSDNSKRLDWPLARVSETFAGQDKQVRVVKVRTARGDVLRPLQRLYPLEMTLDDPGTTIPKQGNRPVQYTPKIAVSDQDEISNTIPFIGEQSTVVTRSGRLVKPPLKLTL